MPKVFRILWWIKPKSFRLGLMCCVKFLRCEVLYKVNKIVCWQCSIVSLSVIILWKMNIYACIRIMILTWLLIMMIPHMFCSWYIPLHSGVRDDILVHLVVYTIYHIFTESPPSDSPSINRNTEVHIILQFRISEIYLGPNKR